MLRIARDTSGETAVEFAIIAPIFFALVFSAFEIGWTMTKQVMLDRAMDVVVRELCTSRPLGFTQ